MKIENTDHIGILILQEDTTTLVSMLKPNKYFVSVDLVFDPENTFMLDQGIVFYKKGDKKLSFIPEPIDIQNTKSI